MPITVAVSTDAQDHCNKRLTIELDEVVLARLPETASVGALRVEAHTNSLALAVDEDDGDGHAKDHEDDGECAKSPVEVDIFVEELRNLGPSKGGGNQGRRVDAKHDQPVPQGGHVGEHNGDDVPDAEVADPVEGVRGGVHLDVDAGGLHDHADDGEEEHDEEALAAAPDVDDLGNGQVPDTTEDGGDNAGGGEEAVLGKGGCHIGDEVALYVLQQRVSEADEVQPGRLASGVQERRCGVVQDEHDDEQSRGPDSGDGLDTLDTGLLEGGAAIGVVFLGIRAFVARLVHVLLMVNLVVPLQLFCVMRVRHRRRGGDGGHDDNVSEYCSTAIDTHVVDKLKGRIYGQGRRRADGRRWSVDGEKGKAIPAAGLRDGFISIRSNQSVNQSITRQLVDAKDHVGTRQAPTGTYRPQHVHGAIDALARKQSFRPCEPDFGPKEQLDWTQTLARGAREDKQTARKLRTILAGSSNGPPQGPPSVLVPGRSAIA